MMLFPSRAQKNLVFGGGMVFPMPYHRHKPVFYRSYHPDLRSDIARLSDMILLRRALVQQALAQHAILRIEHAISLVQ